MSQIDGSLVPIDTKYHDYSMSFIQVLFFYHAGTWHGFYRSSSHGISMAWTRKWWDYPCGFGVTFDQAAVKETWENQCHIFYRDGMIYLSISYLLFRMEYDPLKSYILFFNFTFHKVIKAFAPMVHANSMCYGQGIRLVNSYIFSRFESILSDLHYNISK